jgi:protein-S-isoprenylcysteine O-methyltransferase Ste14
MRRFVPLIILFLLLILSYMADRVLEVADRKAAETFIQTPRVWLNTIAPIVFAAAILGLAWFALIRQPMSRAVSWAYLVIGCLVVFIFPLQLTSGIYLLPMRLSQLTWNSLLGDAGGFAAIIGLLGILRKNAVDHPRETT